MAFVKVNEYLSGQVGEIVLAQPPANILSAAMMAELEKALRELAKVEHRKCILVSGEGAHFSYGASVEEHLPGKVAGMLPAFHRMIGAFVNCDVPLVARVRGLCLGGGFELALACGMIFSEQGAKFGVPEITLGVFPPVAAALLPGICGATRATEIITSGEKFSADYMHALGIINRLSAPENLDQDTMTYIEKVFGGRSASSLRFATRAARHIQRSEFARWIGPLEELYLNDLMASHDGAEGVVAFVEKRKPAWRNG